MRYRNGGAFADAVAAVRAGRRPPRPNQAPTIGRADAGGHPVRRAARCAADCAAGRPPVRGPAPLRGSHRPTPRRGARSPQVSGPCCGPPGVLGALAIVIAVLIVLNAHDSKDHSSSAPTITNTTIVTPPAVTVRPARADLART